MLNSGESSYEGLFNDTSDRKRVDALIREKDDRRLVNNSADDVFQAVFLNLRNGHTLVVGVVARISGGPNRKELSLEDQEDHAKQVVAEEYGGPGGRRSGPASRASTPSLARIFREGV